MNKSTPHHAAGFNPSYVSPRPDVEALVPDGVESILDVGCSVGALGAAIKRKHGCRVFGIELSPAMGSLAREVLDHVYVGDADAGLLSPEIAQSRFDLIIFADVLEHLQDPWSTLRSAVNLLSPRGSIIVSLPNVRHIDTIWNLLVRGRWPYRERGIHDRTHLRFFTKINAIELVEQAGLKIDRMEIQYRISEAPHRWNRYARRLAIPGVHHFLAFQYVMRASPRS
jgi:2-polyprenyl-3-methyl-5-hydroxy-6-metoxy-1,4-benzoquinol methylase